MQKEIEEEDNEESSIVTIPSAMINASVVNLSVKAHALTIKIADANIPLTRKD